MLHITCYIDMDMDMCMYMLHVHVHVHVTCYQLPGARSVSVDKFVKRAMRLESYQQLELMSGNSFSLR